MTNRVFLLSVGLPILLLGLAVWFGNRRRRRQLEEAQANWQTVEGRMLESQVVKQRGARSTVYTCSVRYQYVVGGTLYQGCRATFFDTRTAGSYPQDVLVARYPTGQQVTVYFDPQQPQKSALELSFSEGTGALPAMAGLLLGFGGLITFLGFINC